MNPPSFSPTIYIVTIIVQIKLTICSHIGATETYLATEIQQKPVKMKHNKS